jgi:hypothetical protein
MFTLGVVSAVAMMFLVLTLTVSREREKVS